MNKHQIVFKEILKKFPEPVNLYLTYRGIKKGYLSQIKKNRFLKLERFCKKYKLHLHKKIDSNNQGNSNYYIVLISKKNIPNKNMNVEQIGNFLGYPRNCIHRKKKQKRYSHKIIIQFIYKNSYKLIKNQVYYFYCHKMCYEKMKKMIKKIYDEFNKNLKNLFSFFSIDYHITYIDGYKYGTLN